ncbi:unnamed protein product [Schistosoma mattheei]|uniref:Uncharacterized protein n=1 Tax=Schistosoma mattheei TaxID=31246 RepID=A0A183P3Z1_9TREM|nr:unnamed protein product [Schistosoma mattheei]
MILIINMKISINIIIITIIFIIELYCCFFRR